MRACRLRVRPAEPDVADRLLYARKGDRNKIMREVSDLLPQRPGDTRREERRLREYVDLRKRIDEYVEDLVTKSPPLPPGTIRDVLEILAARSRAERPPPEAIIAAARHLSDDPKRRQMQVNQQAVN